ncbi:MAG: hypothetical protein ACUZ9M_08975 [Candidatus Scalindua sp.]
MHNAELLNEIKFMELKLQALKVQVKSEGPDLRVRTTSNLYGILKDSEDIASEDINAVKLNLKETL